jgi:flotillin
MQIEISRLQFGLHIYNASIKELRDMPGSHYFEYQSRKAHEGAQQSAKVDVAHARTYIYIYDACMVL